MRWKVILSFLFILAIAVAAGFGWYKWNRIHQAKEATRRFEMAVNQIGLGQHEAAQKTLETLLAEFPNLRDKDAAIATLAQSYEAVGDKAKAQACWQKIIDQFPGSPHVPRALSFVAEQLYAEGKTDAALKYWELVQKNFPDSDGADDAAFGRIRMTSDKETNAAVRQALLDFIAKYPDSNRRGEAEAMLGRINIETLYSAEMGPGDEIYKIQRGDTLDSIGKRFSVSPELLARVNAITPERIHTLSIGRRLKVPKTDFSIEVNKTDNTVLLLNKGEFFKRYPCRTGKDEWRTPTGTFHIQRKTQNPSWNDPATGQTYPPNHPENQLGSRWLAFEGSLGIHGTIDPNSIGKYASNGCVGLLKEDVEELFDLVPLGTEVKITGKMQKRANDTKN